MSAPWPRPLHDVRGPISAAKLDGASAGMGDFGPETQALAADGWIPPDMLTGMTLFLLARQPKDPARTQAIPGGSGGVAGGVWVRERFTIHRPLRRDDAFTVRGASEGRHAHKGRRYGTTRSETASSAGERAVSNLTTGLLAYRMEPGLADGVEGRAPDDLPAPEPDAVAAAANPCRARLVTLRAGDVFGGHPVTVSLAMMAARDTRNPDNPIHSDPALARRAGLKRPIAGGSHVLAFALEPILARCGRESLFHGASFDIRWKAPVYADTVIRPTARVVEAGPERVVLDMTVTIDEGSTAMTGRVTVPIA